jgi:hypothetical protein
MQFEQTNPISFFVSLQNFVVNPMKKEIFDLQTFVFFITLFLNKQTQFFNNPLNQRTPLQKKVFFVQTKPISKEAKITTH